MADLYNLKIEQGADFAFLINAKNPTDASPLNLTGATCSAHLRETPSAPLAAAFTCSILSPPESGSIYLSLNNSTTAALTSSCLYYDVEILQYGVVTRLLQGKATISREITR